MSCRAATPVCYVSVYVCMYFYAVVGVQGLRHLVVVNPVVCRAPRFPPFFFFVLDQTNYGWKQDEAREAGSSETSLAI